MLFTLFPVLFLLIHDASPFQTTQVPGQRNDRPVVGILSQEYYGNFRDYKEKKSYIASSYVKWIESSGGRVVPILLDRDLAYYDRLLRAVNGILFPGGGQDLQDSGFARTGRILYQAVKDLNDGGEYFPLWTTCLGYELLFVLETHNFNFSRCNELDTLSNIGFVSDFENLDSRIFAGVTKQQYDTMNTENVTYNYHRWCVTNETFVEHGLDKLFSVVAKSKDTQDRDYISIIESKEYPIYGVQFHPEKPQFEFVVKKGTKNVPHTSPAVRAGQLMGNFFVDECRKNSHDYDNSKVQHLVPLIYNFTPEFTASTSHYVQTYFFDL